jgi:hypothetical protein
MTLSIIYQADIFVKPAGPVGAAQSVGRRKSTKAKGKHILSPPFVISVF